MPTLQATDRTVPVTVRRRIAAAPHTVFDVIAPIDLTRIFRGWGPFPPVIRTEDQSGPWNATGRTRTPRLGDGSTTRPLAERTWPRGVDTRLSQRATDPRRPQRPGRAAA